MEGAIIFASLVVGVAITDQLTSLHRLLRKRSEVRWDPLCLLVALLITLTIIMVWWSIAGGQTSRLTIGQFLPTFVVLVTLFLLAAASLPDGRGEDNATDLRAYYDRNSVYLWTIYFLSSLFSNGATLVANMNAGTGFLAALENQWIDLTIVTLGMGSLIFVRKRWWHWVVVTVLYIGPVFWLGRSLG